jgi:hypothetical protein
MSLHPQTDDRAGISALFEPMNVSVKGPCDIRSDATLEGRTFARSPRGFFRGAVTRGRLTYRHILVLPEPITTDVHSIGELLEHPVVREDFGLFLGQCEQALAEKLGPRGALAGIDPALVRFEHGNASPWAVSKCGTHVAHMHIVPTHHREMFSESLTRLLAEDGRWFQVRGWRSLQSVAANRVEYLYIDVGGTAWMRQVEDEPNLPRQYLRQLVRECLRACGTAVPGHWLWQSIQDDAEEARREATELTGSAVWSRATALAKATLPGLIPA